MSRARPNIVVVVTIIAGVSVAALVARSFFEAKAPPPSADAPTVAAASAPVPSAPQELSSARIAITVPSDSALTSVSYAVVSEGHVVVARGNALIEKQGETATPPAIALPGGQRYTLSVVGNSDAGGVKRATYLGSRAFDVEPGHDTPVSFTPSMGGTVAAESAGAVVAGGGAVAGSNALACQSCELSSTQGICASENITATSDTNPQTGEQTGVGWGCGTLNDPRAQAACVALLHCLNVNGCGHPGENPVTGCYCGAAPAEACMGGQGINGACITEYQAAAGASPGGPSSGAGSGLISQFIASASADPTTPVGLADNINHCASETHCDACQTL